MAFLASSKFALPLLVLSAACLNCAGPVTAQSADDQIAFLRLEMTHSSLSLLETKLRPGTLKTSRSRAGARRAIEYEVLGKSGDVAFADSIDDPLIERREGVNASGELEMVETAVDEAEFTIRVPYSGEEQSIAFYRLIANDGTGKASRHLIGSFELPR